jgi:glycine cleavage system regulatory protein
MTILVLTVVGNDRPGLVDALSGAIAEHGGNWEQSSMAHLANKFAGILTVNVADDRVEAISDALRALREDGLLHVTVEHGRAETPEPRRRLHLDLVGQDHPGIVHDISHALAAEGISIETLETDTRSASMAGGTLFHAKAVLVAPESVAVEQLEEVLEALANELMVDVDLAAET